MDKVDYLEEANRQLTDERFYKKLDSDPTEEFSTKITQELKFIKSTTPGDPLFQQMGTPQKKSPNSSISTLDLM